MAALVAKDGEIRRLNDGCHRPFGVAGYRRSVTVRFCLHLLLFCASFLVGIFLRQNRHAQVSANETSRGHRISIHTTAGEEHAYKLPRAVLLVGGAGFIGMHTALRLQSEGVRDIILVDNYNEEVYSSKLKEERSRVLESNRMKVIKGDACDLDLMQQLVADHDVQGIIYLASQSYARSDGNVKRPFQYPPDNADCFVTILDILKALGQNAVPLIYASGADGYRSDLLATSEGASNKVVGLEDENNLCYNEMIARAYYKLYGISSVGLRLGILTGARGRMDVDAKATENENHPYRSIDDVVHRVLVELGSIAPGFKVVTVPRKNKKRPLVATEYALKRDNEGNEKERGKQTTAPKSRNPADQICFVTSLFSDNPKLIQREGPYPLTNFSNIHSSFKYYYFTNVDAKELPSNGWEIIQLKDMPFQRFITQSRWPKFMGFHHSKLQTCKAIIYSDANRPPNDLAYSEWAHLVEKVLKSKDGIMQDRRPSKETIFQEMHSIVAREKDIAANIDASKRWFLEQKDFHNDAQGWWNMAMVMDPSNPRLRELMTTLWAHYSQEEGSWRDQPLYRYLVDKLSIHPLDLRLEGGHSKYFARVKSSGKHHHYDANTNGVSWQ